MTTLYALREQRDELDAVLLATEGEVTPEMEAQLAALDFSINEKIERCALFVRSQLADADTLDTEADRIKLRAKTKRAAAESLRDYVGREMARLEKTRVDGLLVTVAVQANPPKVVGDVSEQTLRDWYADRSPFVNYRETITLSRSRVLEAYKAGEAIPDGLSVEQTSSVRIK